jgi:hypothetical protein
MSKTPHCTAGYGMVTSEGALLRFTIRASRQLCINDYEDWSDSKSPRIPGDRRKSYKALRYTVRKVTITYDHGPS